jgi:hypothetical protein
LEMVTTRVMIGMTRHEVKPKAIVACEELKKAITKISYCIFQAQDSLIRLNSMGVLAYNGISIAGLEAKLIQVEQSQNSLEGEFGVTDLWR